MCVCVRASPIDYNFSAPASEHPWIDDFSTVCLCTRRRFDRGFINFLPNQTSDAGSFRLRSARERIIAATKSGIGETGNNSERFKRY